MRLSLVAKAPERFSTIEVEWREGVRQLNECEYLCVHAIGEPEVLTLGLIVTEAKRQATTFVEPSDTALESLMVGIRPIEEDDSCRIFEMLFDRRNIVSYTVINESYGTRPEASEEFTGTLFRVFSRSHLLDYIRRTTVASDEYPGKLQHYQIVCQMHIVDVISTAPPRIRVGNWCTEG